MDIAQQLELWRTGIREGHANEILLEMHGLINAAPECASYWLVAGECIEKLGDKALAIDAYSEAARLAGDGKLWRKVAILALAGGQRDKAIQALRNAVDLKPDDVDTSWELATLFMEGGRMLDAHEVLRHVVDTETRDQQLLADFLACCIRINKPGIFLPCWLAIKDWADDSSILANMSSYFISAGNLDEGEQILDRHDQRHPPTGKTLFNRGAIASLKGNFSQAADYFLAAASRGELAPFSISSNLVFAQRDSEAQQWLPRLPLFQQNPLGLLLRTPEGKRIREALAQPGVDLEALKLAASAFRNQRPGGVGAQALVLLLNFAHSRSRDIENENLVAQIFPTAAFLEIVADRSLPSEELWKLALSMLDLNRKDARWASFVFGTYILPGVIQALSLNRPYRAHLLSTTGYQLVQRSPTPETHQQFVEQLMQAFEQHALAHPAPSRPSIDSPSAVTRIAYINDHAMHREAPDDVLLATIAGLHTLFERKLEISLYAAAGISDYLRAKFERLGVKVRAMRIRDDSEPAVDPMLPFAAQMQQALEDDQTEALLYYGTSTSFCMALSTLLNVPLQSYCSVGYQHLHFSRIDGYLIGYHPIGGKVSRTRHGEWWLANNSIPAQIPDARQLLAAQRLKSSLREDGHVLLGSIARPIKLTDDFFDALALILKRCPNALFLWTGYVEDDAVRHKIDERGIGRQCRFVGYVDHVVYADVLDIHLDPFPFASGLTMRQTWHRGGAYVLMYSSYRNGAGELVASSLGLTEASIEHLLALDDEHPAKQKLGEIFGADRRLLAAARSVADYAEMACHLIEAPAFRQAVGHAAQMYSDAFLTNNLEGARDHLQGINYFWQRKFGNAHRQV